MVRKSVRNRPVQLLALVLMAICWPAVPAAAGELPAAVSTVHGAAIDAGDQRPGPAQLDAASTPATGHAGEAAWPALFLAVVAVVAVTMAFWWGQPGQGDVAGRAPERPAGREEEDRESLAESEEEERVET